MHDMTISRDILLVKDMIFEVNDLKSTLIE